MRTSENLGEVRVQAAQAASDDWRQSYFKMLADRDQWRRYAESLEALLAGQPSTPVDRPCEGRLS